MEIIKHDTNQYFILDGVKVYACLSEFLAPHNHILYSEGGRSALDELLSGKDLDISYLFAFLGKLQQTPIYNVNAQEYSLAAQKEEFLFALREFFLNLEDQKYFSNIYIQIVYLSVGANFLTKVL